MLSESFFQSTVRLEWKSVFVAALPFIATICGSASTAFAADAIRLVPEKKIWVIAAGETTYAFGNNERGELQSQNRYMLESWKKVLVAIFL
jgi:hypothetical protein